MSGPRTPSCPLGRIQGAPVDAEAVKRAGWHEQRLLVVSAHDQRLTWPERELIRQLGEKLYGDCDRTKEMRR